MKKPEDIEQWAWDKAEAVAKETARNAMLDPLMPYYISAQPLIARAILSAVEEEREACAKEAEKGHWQHRDMGFGQGEAVWVGPFGPYIASAIRNRKEG